MKKIVLVGFLLTMLLTACVVTDCPAGYIGEECQTFIPPYTPEVTPTHTCQPPQGWIEMGRYVPFEIKIGNVIIEGSIQLSVDEINGVLEIEGRKPAVFPVCSQATLNIGPGTIQFFMDQTGSIWFSPETWESVTPPAPVYPGPTPGLQGIDELGQAFLIDPDLIIKISSPH